jgi:protein AATF/BFR2
MFRGSGKPKDGKPGVRKQRLTAADFMESGEEDEEEQEDLEVDEEESAEDEDMSDGGAPLDGTDESGSESNPDQSDVEQEEESEESEDDDDEDEDKESGSDDEDEEKSRRAELRKMMSEEQKTVVATISQAAKADAEKGRAVKAQRKAFDSLLNVRISLQKALIATNSMAAVEHEDEDDKTPYKAAEEAAIKLLNTLTSMRHSLQPTTSAGKKRKLAQFDPSSTSTAIWSSISSYETDSKPKRQATLEKWSSKVRGTTATPSTSKLNRTADARLTDVLSDQLSGTSLDRLVKRTHLPRSCAPLQVKAKLVDSPAIFDDADFYTLLLKELVDQRMVDASSNPSLDANGRPVAQWAAAREAKTKRVVDTRASKGRKMSFKVHEKLMNFMAPEDRTGWEAEAVDRFFGTLLGQRLNLGEEDGEGEGEEEEEEAGRLGEEEALMLFRS